ncbi:MAG: HD-GYP domain-containing protein [Gemmatimonadaceae bacterium]
MNRASKAAVAGVWVCALAGAALLYHLDPVPQPEAAAAAAWFCGLGLLGYLLTFVKARGGPIGTVAYLPYATALLLSPNWLTVLGLGLTALVADVVARRGVFKTWYNVGQGLVTGVCSALTLRALGVTGQYATQLPSFVSSLPFLFATAGVFLGSGSVALSAVISSMDRRPFLKVFRSLFFDGILGDILAIPFIFVFAKVYHVFGGVGVILLSVPLVGLRQLYSANWQLKRTNEELLELMVAAIEARDPYTSGHSRRVAQYSRTIAEGIGLPSKKVDEVVKAALLHDVGKIDEKYAPLLRKPTRLTEEEEAIMKTHAIRSAELVAKVSNLTSLVAPVRHHHEAWDGTGYPDGLAGERIPLASRVIAFADTIDAMTSERPYRGALSPDSVRAELVRCRGSQFDPRLTDQVLSSTVWRELFPGSLATPSRPLVVVSHRKTRIG